MLYVQNIQEIYDFYGYDEVQAFRKYWDKIEASNPGAKKLIKNLCGAEKSGNIENFLNYLVEFNVAKIFYDKNIPFEYEKKGLDDFNVQNYLISVKSIHESKYQKFENEIIQNLNKGSDRDVIENTFGQSPVRSVTEFNKLENAIEITQIGQEPNAPLPFEVDRKDRIIKAITKLERIDSERTKVLFVFLQTAEITLFHQRDLTDWYFYNEQDENDLAGSEYQKWFAEDAPGSLKNGSVKAIIFLYSPNNILLWKSSEIMRVDSRGNRAFTIWAHSRSVNENLEKIFFEIGGAVSLVRNAVARKR